ncbi:M36 family metallopeptidase [Melittangium boletus]|uniref:M36 family metallopeptidase n=1 Tax=Melittangium boletus TaxID=83453 RepID=UPI003DA61B3A
MGWDSLTGRPTLLWSQPGDAGSPFSSPGAAASWYLERLAPFYAWSNETPRTAFIHRIHDTGRGGIIVSFRQRIEGIELFEQELDVLLGRDLRLIAVGGGLHGVPDSSPRYAFALSAAEAVIRAHHEVSPVRISAMELHEVLGTAENFHTFTLTLGPPLAPSPGLRARARRLLVPREGGLSPAYLVETHVSAEDRVPSRDDTFVISAEDGRVLKRWSLTHADSFEYRVWADGDSALPPLDSPLSDSTPHPTGRPDGSEFPPVPQRMVRTAGRLGDPWLSPGATESRGNNVDAYADLGAPDGFTPGLDVRAQVTSSGAFGHIYDVTRGPKDGPSQTQAAITQLFYTTNWLHDDFYLSGFDEASGNAQEDNFGRGGVGGDPLLAEAQDHQGFNNATMSVPADGASPRMQIFTWTGEEQSFVEVAGKRHEAGTAFFGARAFRATHTLRLLDDAMADPSPHDGCEPWSMPAGDTLLLIQRGRCPMALKALHAERAGAAGVIIINNVPGEPPPRMTNDDESIVVTIPVLSVTYEVGELLKRELKVGSLTATACRDALDRDGALDNTLVAHEWGHYLHLRLMSACTTAQCLSMSEGWADFIALHLMLRENDSLEGSYAIASYATKALGDSAYFGIRRAPYSTDRRINDFSLRHISEGEPLPVGPPLANRKPLNSEVHNAGEIFATILFEGYIALLRDTRLAESRMRFATARRAMADYIVGAIKLAPPNATYTEQLQAMLAVAAANDLTHHALLAEAFARRGAGACAVSPPRDSVDLTGVSEDFLASSPCGEIPIAEAGPSQFLVGGQQVRLDATRSLAPRGGSLSFHWEQVSGPVVHLEDRERSIATFLAPPVSTVTVLTFRVTVALGYRATVDTVDIQLLPGGDAADGGGPSEGQTDAGSPPRPPEVDPGASGPQAPPCGCGLASGASARGWAFVVVLLLVVGARRRA